MDRVYTIKQMDYNHPVVCQYTRLLKCLRGISSGVWARVNDDSALHVGLALFGNYYDFEVDDEHAYSEASIKVYVNALYVYSKPIQSFETSVLLDWIVGNDPMKRFFLTLTHTKQYQIEYDGELLTDAIQFQYKESTFYYEYDQHGRLFVCQLRPVYRREREISNMDHLMQFLSV